MTAILLRRSAAVLAGAVVLAAAAALSPAVPAAAEENPAYAGSAACARCHAATTAAWRTSAHALTMAAAGPASLPGDAAAGGEVAHPPGTTTFARAGDRFTASVECDDGARRTVSVDWVIGFRRMTMIVSRQDDGRHQVLPAMREQPSGPWFDYTHLLFGAPDGGPDRIPEVRPGEPSFWTGPDRSFDARCARCHTSGREVRETPSGERGARSSWRAPGIDCEECHGPAAAHVAHWDGPPAPGTADPLRAGRPEDRERSLSACLVCHLEGEPVGGHFRAGGDVLGHVVPTLLDDGARVDAAGAPVELIYEGLSFLSSTCAVAGKLVCTDCHDVHGSAQRAALVVAAGRTDALCVRCHGSLVAAGEAHTHHPKGAGGASCVACHMPTLTIERGHGAVHDHSIGSPWPDARRGAASRDACTGCHTGRRGADPAAPPLGPKELREAFQRYWPGSRRRPAWAADLDAARAGDESAAPALTKLAWDRGAPRVVRASAAKLLSRFPATALRELPFLATDRDAAVRGAALAALGSVAGAEASAAFRRGLTDTSAAVRAAASRAALEGWVRVQEDADLLAAVLPVLEETALAVPDDPARWFRLGAARQIAGDPAGAVAAYERKLALDPGARLVRQRVAQLKAKLAGRRSTEERP